MITRSQKALLPAGMSDRLPPEADQEDDAADRILATFKTHGYQRVKPPLLEFEETLLSGGDQRLAKHTFRLMDPVSRRMMGIRADATPQISRIATTRLIRRVRPLRLSYHGEVLRVSGTQLRPERQFRQVGAELIGAASAEADVEIISMALEALTTIGVKDISVDLGLPTLVPRLANGFGLNNEKAEVLRDALNRKDAADVQAATEDFEDAPKALFRALLDAAGPADRAMGALDGLAIADKAETLLNDLRNIVRNLRKSLGNTVTMTVDPVDNRGFEYHSGATFTVFARGVRGELGNGGRYQTEPDDFGHWEACTGLTLFMDAVLEAMPQPKPPKRILAAMDTPRDALRSLRRDGWAALRMLEEGDATAKRARDLNCTHYLASDGPRSV